MPHSTWLLRVAQDIKNRYGDGEPLNRADRRIMLDLLRHHPDARRKFGAGINDVFVAPYVGGHRCFWVSHPDGSVEDFSVRRCLGRGLPRTERVSSMMTRFNLAGVVRAYRMARAQRRGRP